jgi:hypothetical protein
LDIILATIKVNFGYYEKLFWHFEFGDDHLLTKLILANMYDSVAMIKAIKDRFPESELYGNFSIFDPKELPDDCRELGSYGNQELEFLGDFYGEAKN